MGIEVSILEDMFLNKRIACCVTQLLANEPDKELDPCRSPLRKPWTTWVTNCSSDWPLCYWLLIPAQINQQWVNLQSPRHPDKGSTLSLHSGLSCTLSTHELAAWALVCREPSVSNKFWSGPSGEVSVGQVPACIPSPELYQYPDFIPF